MKFRVGAAIVLVFIVQIAILAFAWGSPALKAERAITPTPSRTPNYTPTPPPPTPIPTLYPAELAAPTQMVSQGSYDRGQCEIAALDLIAAWVQAGKPEQAAFDFQDTSGRACQATFPADVFPLFKEPNIWFAGAIACATCHSADVKNDPANLSLADYASILAGSHRTDPSTPGQDILGSGGPWEKSKLYFMITTHLMPVGRPASSPDKGPDIHVGTFK
jgi:hypothetical protein